MPLVELLKTRFDVLHEEAFRAILHLIESGDLGILNISLSMIDGRFRFSKSTLPRNSN